MFLSIGMLKLNYFLADIFILSAEKQPIKLSWRKIKCLPVNYPQNIYLQKSCDASCIYEHKECTFLS